MSCTRVAAPGFSDGLPPVIAAFPQTKDDMTKLVMLDPKSCPEHWPGMLIYRSAGAAATLLRELLRRRAVACDGDKAFVDDHLCQLLTFFQLLFTHPSAKDDHVRQRDILCIFGVQDMDRPSLSVGATLVDLASNPATARMIAPDFVRALRDIAQIIEHDFLAAADDFERSCLSDRLEMLTQTVRRLGTRYIGLEAQQSSPPAT